MDGHIADMKEADTARSRKQVQFMVDPEALAYLDEKGERFASKGGRGGRSEALNRIVLMVKELEPKLEKIMMEGE